jgi:Ca2+:H+ antiporter
VRWRLSLSFVLLAAPLAVAAAAWHWSPVALFCASGLAIVPLARLIGVATEVLAGRLGAAAGGLLNATFGNATELIIAIVALQAGLSAVVKASLVGSILGNVLAVLGLAFLLGGLRRKQQRFDRTAASAAGAQLAVAGGALLIPTVLAATAPVKPLALEELSVVAAAALLLAYGAGLLFSLRTHAHLYMVERAEVMHGPGWSGRRAVVVLLLATVGVAVLSELLVEGVKGVTAGVGWTPMFVGVILVALIGNAAEHASAVTVARRDQMDLSLAIRSPSRSAVRRRSPCSWRRCWCCWGWCCSVPWTCSSTPSRWRGWPLPSRWSTWSSTMARARGWRASNCWWSIWSWPQPSSCTPEQQAQAEEAMTQTVSRRSSTA